MKEQLFEYPIHKAQHGFCSEKSTESAMSNTSITLEQTKTSNTKHTIITSLDIQAAFDSILPENIKQALLRHGSNKDFADWYHNYITHRNLTTELNGETYEATTGIGFPQGGVVSAEFWKIVFNPAIEIINSDNTTGTGYADDLVLMRTGYSVQKSIQILQHTLDKLVQWGATCGLQFNAEKTIVVCFSKSNITPTLKVQLNGTPIEYSNSFKYLGVTIDNKLTWAPHRENVIRTAKMNLVKLSSKICLLYTSPSPRDGLLSRMPSSA